MQAGNLGRTFLVRYGRQNRQRTLRDALGDFCLVTLVGQLIAHERRGLFLQVLFGQIADFGLHHRRLSLRLGTLDPLVARQWQGPLLQFLLGPGGLRDGRLDFRLEGFLHLGRFPLQRRNHIVAVVDIVDVPQGTFERNLDFIYGQQRFANFVIIQHFSTRKFYTKTIGIFKNSGTMRTERKLRRIHLRREIQSLLDFDDLSLGNSDMN